MHLKDWYSLLLMCLYGNMDAIKMEEINHEKLDAIIELLDWRNQRYPIDFLSAYMHTKKGKFLEIKLKRHIKRRFD